MPFYWCDMPHSVNEMPITAIRKVEPYTFSQIILQSLGCMIWPTTILD